MTETLNDRLDRMELEIKSLKELIGKSPAGTKPKDRDLSKEIKDEINTTVTRNFVNELYRGTK